MDHIIEGDLSRLSLLGALQAQALLNMGDRIIWRDAQGKLWRVVGISPTPEKKQ